MQHSVFYLLRDDKVWQKQIAVQSCSDADIAPLTQTAYAQLSGLSVTNTFNQITVDIRGNETRTFGNETQRTTQIPSCSNLQVETYAFGQLVETVDTACVTNRFEYDALDRRIASIDGRNNRTVYAYDAKGNLVSVTDAIGAVTAYGYDVMGQTVAITNALGNVTVYGYDLRGNKTYEGGATYPVRYTYDLFGNKTSMTTYRNEASGVGDTTTWTYDEASGLLLAKTYADGKGLTYTYTNDGRLATRTNAHNIVTTYAYDAWGQLLFIDYADTTPDIAYVYDAMGRQTSATDAVGTTTFTYDAFGQLTAEQVSGLYSKTLTRHWDAFGRNVGYSVDNDRKQSITYDSATGRIAESDGFAWDYLAGSNLKSQLTYPNEAVVTWSYEPRRDLLSAVTNATYSTYVYTNDLLGRRTSKNDEQYSYNVRDELIAADEVSYAYDDIGNRTTAEGKTYTANNLNQYTAIDDFVPQYDDDGNQTLIKTETGIWSVIYNAENRPIRWQSGDTVITMAFDRMGRRVEMRTVKDGEETLQRFVYDNYLCIQQLRGTNNALFHSYVWDPTEPIATRPLIFRPASGVLSYYFHDGNKNVSDLVSLSGAFVHYDYTPFGTSTASASSENPFRFSSEFYDNTLALVYYNYRHYNPNDGRWLNPDPIGTQGGENVFGFLSNAPNALFDLLGLVTSHLDLKACTYTLTFVVVFRNTGDGDEIDDLLSYLATSSTYKEKVEKTFNSHTFKIGQSDKRIIRCCPEGVKPILNIKMKHYMDGKSSSDDFILHVDSSKKGGRRAWTHGSEMHVWTEDFVSDRPTLAHEFGHVLGLQHPGKDINNPTLGSPIDTNSTLEYEYSGLDINGRPVAAEDLMGTGTDLREFYFDLWKERLLNETF